MDKVWIVSEGEYSDWTILGIYSTIEKAIEAKVRAGTENPIDEYELDAMPDEPDGEYKWMFAFDNDGNVETWKTGCDFTCRRGASKHRHGINVFAIGKTFDAALKSATDTRRMALAMNPQPAIYQMIEFD